MLKIIFMNLLKKITALFYKSKKDQPRFFIGQKVYCFHHQTLPHRSSVQFGRIVSKAGIKPHPFFSTNNGVGQWYNVELSYGTFEYPSTCLKDLDKYIESTWSYLDFSERISKNLAKEIVYTENLKSFLFRAECFKETGKDET